MGVFTGGKVYGWGDPTALLTFPHLSLWQKIRYGLFALVSVRKNQWPAIEPESAKSWITRWCGEGVYNLLWQPLFHFKFYEHADNISATWIWTRVRRIGRSRKSMMQEQLGYIRGGSITLVDALVEGIRQHGGRVHLGEPAIEITSGDGKVTGVQTKKGFYPADAVICTSPTPYVSALVPSLPGEWQQRYDAIHNVAVICVIFKLRQPVTPHFWVNISEPGIEIPGIIEFSNLRNVGGDSIVYVPYYMPATHAKFSWPDEALLDEAFACLKRINPSLTEQDIRATKVARLKYAQPVCEPNFAAKIPPVQTPIAGLQIADTCYYYPEDRGIAESVRLGQQMAVAIGGL